MSGPAEPILQRRKPKVLEVSSPGRGYLGPGWPSARAPKKKGLHPSACLLLEPQLASHPEILLRAAKPGQPPGSQATRCSFWETHNALAVPSMSSSRWKRDFHPPASRLFDASRSWDPVLASFYPPMFQRGHFVPFCLWCWKFNPLNKLVCVEGKLEGRLKGNGHS